MPKQIFRKVALERIASPEQLDQLITITSPLGWLALLTIGGLLISAVFWGVYGSIPTKVQGQGILLRKGGLLSIQPQVSGTITAINIEVDELVEQGDIIARIRQDHLLEEIQKAQLDLENITASFTEQQKAEEDFQGIQLQQISQDRTNQEQQIRNLEIQLEAQKALLLQKEEFRESVASLVKEGIYSKNRILEIDNEIVTIRQQIDALTLEVDKAKNQLHTLSLQVKKIASSETLTKLEYTQKVEQLKLLIQNLQRDFAERSQVVSPYSGRVVEIVATTNSLVSQGTPLVILEPSREDVTLEAVVYFSALTGKKIRKGMEAQVLPTTVKVEEFGFMKGFVTEVDKYPSTLQSVMKTLQNQALAQLLTENAPPIKVTVALIRDEKTPSGYRWSSREGPPVEVHGGTICFGEILVKEQAPITLVIPILKKYLLGVENPLERLLEEKNGE